MKKFSAKPIVLSTLSLFALPVLGACSSTPADDPDENDARVSVLSGGGSSLESTSYSFTSCALAGGFCDASNHCVRQEFRDRQFFQIDLGFCGSEPPIGGGGGGGGGGSIPLCVDAGNGCTRNSQCCSGLVCNDRMSGVPNDKICTSVCGGEGATCEDRFNCCSGVTCSNGRCVRLGGIGQNCSSNSECKGGLKCGLFTRTCQRPTNYSCHFDAVRQPPNYCDGSDWVVCPVVGPPGGCTCVFQDASRPYAYCL